MYATGKGVPKNDQESAEWHRKAAEQGDALAQRNLGLKYALGTGVPKDYVKAYAWVSLAAAQGDKSSIELKNYLRPGMSPEQVAEAEQLAADLRERIPSLPAPQTFETVPLR